MRAPARHSESGQLEDRASGKQHPPPSRLLWDIVVAALLFSAIACSRLWVVDEAMVNFDTIDPFTRAFAWLTDLTLIGRGGLSLGEALWPPGDPWANQFGPALVWLHAPFVAGADSLREAFVRRYLFQALTVTAVYAAVRWGLVAHLVEPRETDQIWAARLGAVAAAALIGVGGPFGTFPTNDQIYLAGDLAAWLSAAAVLVVIGRQPRWLSLAFAVLPLAMMCHPLAISHAPAALLLARVAWKRGARGPVLLGLGVGAACAVPGVAHLAIRWSEGLSPAEISQAHGAFNQAEVLLRTTGAAFWTLKPWPTGLVLLIAPTLLIVLRPVMVPRTPRSESTLDPARSSGGEGDAALLGAWAALDALGLLTVGILLGYLRSYHWNHVLPALAVATGALVYAAACRAQLWTDGGTRHALRTASSVLAVVTFVAVVKATHDRPRGDADIERTRVMAEALQADAGADKRWLDGVLLGQPYHNRYSKVYMGGVYLEQRLMGVPRSAFDLDGHLYLAVGGRPDLIGALRREMGWTGGVAWANRAPVADFDVGAVEGNVEGFPGVRPIGWYRLNEIFEAQLVRIDEGEDSRRWTAWLHRRFSGECFFQDDWFHLSRLVAPDLPLDVSHRWFDRELIERYQELR